MGERCTKCGEEERAKGSSWGKGCLAQAAKERRMRHGNATDATPDATSHDDATASHAPRGTALQVARKRVVELEEEVARLKRELAAARTLPRVDYVGKVGMRTDAVSPSLARAGIGKATAAKADFGCAGPGRCAKIHEHAS